MVIKRSLLYLHNDIITDAKLTSKNQSGVKQTERYSDQMGMEIDIWA